MKNILITITVLLGILASLCVASNGTEISINRLNDCKGETFNKIGSAEPSFGKTFLVAGIEVVNKGYNTFYVEPSHYSIERNGGRRSRSSVPNDDGRLHR